MTATYLDSGLRRVEFKKDLLSFFPLHVIFSNKASSTAAGGNISGFTLNWFIEDSNGTQLTKQLPARNEDWKQEVPTPAYKEEVLSDIVDLVRSLLVQNMSEDKIFKEVFHQKLQNINSLDLNTKCSMGQIKPNYQRVEFSKLVKTLKSSKTSTGPPTDDDIKSGLRLFRVLVYCSSSMALELYQFIDHLIFHESKRTLIHTVINIFLKGAITDKASYNLVGQFYQEMTTVLDLQYGNVLFATSTKAQLETALDNSLPFFGNHTDLVDDCLHKSNCERISTIFQALGIVFLLYFSLALE